MASGRVPKTVITLIVFIVKSSAIRCVIGILRLFCNFLLFILLLIELVQLLLVQLHLSAFRRQIDSSADHTGNHMFGLRCVTVLI